MGAPTRPLSAVKSPAPNRSSPKPRAKPSHHPGATKKKKQVKNVRKSERNESAADGATEQLSQQASVTGASIPSFPGNGLLPWRTLSRHATDKSATNTNLVEVISPANRWRSARETGTSEARDQPIHEEGSHSDTSQRAMGLLKRAAVFVEVSPPCSNTSSSSDSDTSEESETNPNPIKYISPAILESLQHLDVTSALSYNPRKVICGGAYGDVLKGRVTTDRGGKKVKVCIKRLRFYLREDIQLLFEKEIYVWSKLDHRNILPLLGYAFDNHSGYPLLVSTWMKKGSAFKYVLAHKDCNLLRIIIGIAKGLAYLHEKGIVHSDIKSDNVLITDSEDAVICDFGFSRMLAASKSLGKLSTGVRGTARYLSYELVTLLGAQHSKESDVWAFGMVIFELLTRQRAYGNATEVQVIAAIMRLDLPSLPRQNHAVVSQNVADMLCDICQLCWRQDPSHRPDMDVVVERLVSEALIEKAWI